ncbi:MAG TPA: hypothetical protein VIX82_16145 [Solirubrobacteraceae bacterium]
MPFQTSPQGFPANGVVKYGPAAMHVPPGAQETPVSRDSIAPVGPPLGVLSTHLVPSQLAARGESNPPAVTPPMAKHWVTVLHETLSKSGPPAGGFWTAQ